jgi:hypothetical protein
MISCCSVPTSADVLFKKAARLDFLLARLIEHDQVRVVCFLSGRFEQEPKRLDG